MAELTIRDAGTANPCCTSQARATCCEPSAKAQCCGPKHGEGCACAAGATSTATLKLIGMPPETL